WGAEKPAAFMASDNDVNCCRACSFLFMFTNLLYRTVKCQWVSDIGYPLLIMVIPVQHSQQLPMLPRFLAGWRTPHVPRAGYIFRGIGAMADWDHRPPQKAPQMLLRDSLFPSAGCCRIPRLLTRRK